MAGTLLRGGSSPPAHNELLPGGALVLKRLRLLRSTGDFSPECALIALGGGSNEFSAKLAR